MASTTIPGTSKELLDRMRAAWPAFRIAAGTLTAGQMEERTPSGWTYKEMLGHVAAWHESSARRIAIFRATGRTEPDPAMSRGLFEHLGLSAADRDALLEKWDVDGFNRAVATASAAKDRRAILRELDESFDRLRSAVSGLTDEQVQAHVEDGRPFAVAIVQGDTYEHYPEHQEELAAAAPKTGAAVAERIDEDWVRFREAVRHIGRARLADRIPGASKDGWTTYKDLVAHVIGWLEDVPRRIEAIRAGTHKPIGSKQEIDDYNARSVATRALVGPEALLDELDTAYRRMRETVQGLSDEEVRTPRILLMVIVRTVLHWEEHEKELEAGPARGATR